MATPFESAQLLLTLYDQRREETMRKARDRFVAFDPKSFDELMAEFVSAAYVRQVVSYWEMAASFVSHGAIDAQMFLDANGEFLIVFSKIEPFLTEIREKMGNPGFAVHLEKLAMGLPNARERIDATRERMRALMAARSAARA